MLWEEKNAIYKHTIKCSELKCINLDSIRDRKFKVVIDAVNGAGANALPEMLNLLGCEVVKLDCEPSGVFKRGTEPLPVNLSELSKQVLENNADLGFAVDPDADRLAVVDEKGRPLGEEYTLVLSVDGYINTLGVESDIFVSNLSTSIALDKLALKNNCKVERSAVGEINVVNKMNELDSNLGGEGNGGVILRECHLGRDSLVAVTMVLNRVAQSTYPLSEIYNSLPQFEIVKDKVNVDGIKIDDFLSKVNNYFKEGKKNTIDGLKITWQEKWVHLRASNTEPIVRIYAEAPIKKEAEELVLQIKSLI
jgi:phosphomannomutase